MIRAELVSRIAPVAVMLLAVIAPARADDDNDVNAANERVMKSAAAKVAPTVVKIETAGGLEVIGGGKKAGPGAPPTPGIARGTGPTTGLIGRLDLNGTWWAGFPGIDASYGARTRPS